MITTLSLDLSLMMANEWMSSCLLSFSPLAFVDTFTWLLANYLPAHSLALEKSEGCEIGQISIGGMGESEKMITQYFIFMFIHN